MTTDAELVSEARRGDGAAVRALYDRHSGRVYATVRRFAGSDALAEEWAQEAWIRALRALPGFRGDALFSTWLHRVAVNCALHARRGIKRRRQREDGAEPPPRPVPHDERTVLRVGLERAVARLPERMRMILLLYDVEGYSHAEIGEVLGVSEGTSKSQLFKARAKMRRMLRSGDEEPERARESVG
ncbi:MAG: RNA polymerase sigma factor [Longimicrobiaceae bacterium]